MKLLKTILQSKIFYLSLIILTTIYVILKITIKYESIYNLNETTFSGKIIKIKPTDYGYSITIKTNYEKLIFFLKDSNYQIGDLVKITGTLEKCKNNTILNNFNYKEYLYQNKIFYLINVKKITLVKENKNIIFKLKTKINNYFDTFKSKIYLKSFILGDTSYLKDIYDSYQINGICHLLSIGSTHITLLNIVILFIFKKLKITKKIAYLFSFSLIFLFLLLTDFPISILRVYLSLILAYINKNLNLKIKTANLFLLTLIITLIINPFYIYNKGFLYSYSISLALILNKNQIKGNYFQKLLIISLISSLVSLPFNIYFNYSINILSIFYNIFYVSFFNIIIFPLSLLTMIFPLFDSFLYLIMDIANKISYWLNNLTFGILIFKKINIYILIFYLIIVFITLKSIFKKKKKILILFIIILFIHYNINKLILTNFYLTIDVKQGDSSLLSYNNQTILIDTGGLYKQTLIDKTIIMLKSLGIRQIDYLVLTHGDYDHIGEAINLINSFKVNKVIFNCGEFNELEQDLIKDLKKKEISYYSCIKKISIDNNILYFLNNKDYGNENDNSSIIYIKLNNHKFLLMGDAGREVEKDLIKKYDLQDIDVLKVGHHGSKTSSSKEFITSINPKYSIISVGKNNLYNHPNDDVLKNLENSKIYRTDENGSIMFKINKDKLNIKTYEP